MLRSWLKPEQASSITAVTSCSTMYGPVSGKEKLIVRVIEAGTGDGLIRNCETSAPAIIEIARKKITVRIGEKAIFK